MCCGLDHVAPDEPCIVVWADQVGVTSETMGRVAEALNADRAGLVLPLVEVEAPYVWYTVSANGVEVRRRRDGDESPDRGKTDVGTFGFRAGCVRPLLDDLVAAGCGQGRERDFIYVVPRVAQQYGLCIVEVDDPSETLSVNDQRDLRKARLHLEEVQR